MAEARTGNSIRPQFQVDWEVFCEAGAHSVDTTVAPPLFELDPRSIALFVTTQPPKQQTADSLPARTLRRGACLRLATGQQAATSFGLNPKLEAPANKPDDYTPFKDTDDLGFTGDMPLW